MTEPMVSKIIELETLTPLFIKGKDLDYGEGMLRGSDGVVYLIDNDKLCEYVADKGKIEEYVKEFDGRNKRPSLKDFLNRNGIYPNDSKLLKIAKGITEISEKARFNDEKQKNNFVQNGNKIPFIPGASLKGAIRNAVLWKCLEDNKNESLLDAFFNSQRAFLDKEVKGVALINDALDKAEDEDFESADEKMSSLFEGSFSRKNQFEKSKNRDGFIVYTKDFNSVEKTLQEYQKKFAKSFSKKTFQNNRSILPILKLEQLPCAAQDFACISMKDFNDRWQKAKRNKSLIDFFRLVKVSDGNFVEYTTLDWQPTKTVCKNNFGQTYIKEHTATLECVPNAVKAHFKISIDTELAKKFFPDGIPDYLQSVEGLLNVVNEFFRAVSDFEKTQFYSGAKPISNNINGKEKVDTKQVEKLYKSTFGVQPNDTLFRIGWGGGFMSKTQFLHLTIPDRVRVRDMIRYNSSPIAPKSRCLIVEGENATEPLGWCKFRVLGDAKDTPLPSINEANIKTDLLTEQSRGQQDAQQHRQGRRKNHERHVSEKQIQYLNEAANKIVKRAEKQKASALHKTYKTGEKVDAVVESCVPLQSVTVKINEKTLIIKKGIIKQKGETVTLQITKTENGEIIEAKLL